MPIDSESTRKRSRHAGSESEYASTTEPEIQSPDTEASVKSVSDTNSEASSAPDLEDGEPVITVVGRKELNRAFAKLRSAGCSTSTVTDKERVQAYHVLLRSYVSVLPMSASATREWQSVRRLTQWVHEQELFGGNWQDLLVHWELPYQRQKDVFEELLRGQVLVRIKTTEYDGGSGPCDVWRWTWSQTELGKKVRSSFAQSMQEDCPMCRTLDPDWHPDDCSHQNFNEQHPDVRHARKKLHSVLVEYLASNYSFVARALTDARELVTYQWYAMQCPKLYFYDDFRRAEQKWPIFSPITGKRLTANYLCKRRELTALDMDRKGISIHPGLDDWIHTEAIDILIDWGFFSTFAGPLPVGRSIREPSALLRGQKLPNGDMLLPAPAILKQLLAETAEVRRKVELKIAKSRSAMLQERPAAPDHWVDFYHSFGRPLRVVNDDA